mgnify:CR=1 FL=1
MRSIVYATASEEDLRELYELEIKCFGEEAYSPHILLFYIKISREGFVVARDSETNKIIGYVIGLAEHGGRVGHVISLCVDPMYRRSGLATSLMRLIEELFIKRNICLARLEVKVSNTPAINLYKKLGYEIKGLLRKYYKDGSDAYIMTRTLCSKSESDLYSQDEE